MSSVVDVGEHLGGETDVFWFLDDLRVYVAVLDGEPFFGFFTKHNARKITASLTKPFGEQVEAFK